MACGQGSTTAKGNSTWPSPTIPGRSVWEASFHGPAWPAASATACWATRRRPWKISTKPSGGGRAGRMRSSRGLGRTMPWGRWTGPWTTPAWPSNSSRMDRSACWQGPGCWPPAACSIRRWRTWTARCRSVRPSPRPSSSAPASIAIAPAPPEQAKADLEAALADFTAVVRLSPGHAETYSARAAVRMRLEDFTEALADCEKAIQLDPDCVPAYLCRANIHFIENRLAQAMLDCNQALRVAPGYADALRREAWFARGWGCSARPSAISTRWSARPPTSPSPTYTAATPTACSRTTGLPWTISPRPSG